MNPYHNANGGGGVVYYSSGPGTGAGMTMPGGDHQSYKIMSGSNQQLGGPGAGMTYYTQQPGQQQQQAPPSPTIQYYNSNSGGHQPYQQQRMVQPVSQNQPASTYTIYGGGAPSQQGMTPQTHKITTSGPMANTYDSPPHQNQGMYYSNSNDNMNNSSSYVIRGQSPVVPAHHQQPVQSPQIAAYPMGSSPNVISMGGPAPRSQQPPQNVMGYSPQPPQPPPPQQYQPQPAMQQRPVHTPQPPNYNQQPQGIMHPPASQPHHAPPQNHNKPAKRREMPSSARNSFSMDNGAGMEGPPQFVAQPKPNITVMEGDPIVISARVKPAGDSSLKVDWYRNGKPLTAASRYNPSFDRGYAVLEFLYTNEDDGGEYYCIAQSNSGRDQSASCHITIHTAEGVVTDTQLPEESMVANLAAMEEYLEQNDLMRNRREEEKICQQPPMFVRQLVPQLGLRENDPAHFECVVEPAGDPNLIVEWYKDGKPVSMGCRFNATLDRGFAILDIMYTRADDSGQYCCIVRNSKGQVQSNVVQLHCTETGGIITQSALSKDSIAFLESLDSWTSEAMAAFDSRPVPEDLEEPSAPTFVILPKPLVALEGTPARFLVRADGNPRPRVQWYINGDMIASSGQGGNWRIFQDGGISYLEFHRCSHPDVYQVRIVAKNQHGEATADTTLTIEPQPDYRPDLKHVQIENTFKKMMMLKHVDCTAELVQKMHKPKADAIELRKIERTNEHKGKFVNNEEVEETENLYIRVQQSLRSGRQGGPPMPIVQVDPQPSQQPPAKPPQSMMMTGGQQQQQPPPPQKPNQYVIQSQPAQQQPQQQFVMQQQPGQFVMQQPIQQQEVSQPKYVMQPQPQGQQAGGGQFVIKAPPSQPAGPQYVMQQQPAAGTGQYVVQAQQGNQAQPNPMMNYVIQGSASNVNQPQQGTQMMKPTANPQQQVFTMQQPQYMMNQPQPQQPQQVVYTMQGQPQEEETIVFSGAGGSAANVQNPSISNMQMPGQQPVNSGKTVDMQTLIDALPSM